ncbi:tetratricopeptide repeat protein [bacterium]|nr:tetratricopeptide repeat protein [candidate division CSSED10-310 bacterium]
MNFWLDWIFYLSWSVLGGLAGWYLHVFLSGRTRIETDSQSLGQAITALASGEKEKAVEALTHVVARDTHELHAYLTLGILYRRKGWFNRAVDIHRRLLSRTNIDNELRHRIYIELALDFEDAGLLDRAVGTIREALKLPGTRRGDYALLGRLYETTGEWDLAVDAWRHSGDQSIWRQPVAFITAMDGLKSRSSGDIRKAVKLFRQALKVDPENPAALLGYAEICAVKGKLSQAIELYEKLQETRPDLTGVIADSIERIMKETGNRKVEDFYVETLKTQKYKPRVAIRYAAYLADRGEMAQAAAVLKTTEPAKLAPEMLLRLVETSEKVGFKQQALNISRQILDKVVSRDRFICHLCGDSMPLLEWRCPKCRNWGSVRSTTEYDHTSQESEDS